MKNKSLDLYQKRGIMQFCGGKKDTSSLTFLLLNKLDKLYVFSCLNKQAGFKKQRFPLWRTLPPFQPQTACVELNLSLYCKYRNKKCELLLQNHAVTL